MARNRLPVTQRVPLDRVDDLLTRPARGAIAFVGVEGPECIPVRVVAEDGIRIGLDPDQLEAAVLPERAVLVVDDGSYWFELRAAVLRGTIGPRDDAAADGLVWHDFEPRRVAAWDYGQLHEEHDP